MLLLSSLKGNKMSEEKKTSYSIHGRDSSGKQSKSVYNPAPQENKEPSTKRGLRRKAKKEQGK